MADWLDRLRVSALVGTARREPPGPPAGLGVRPARLGEHDDRERALLEAAALADVLLRAGRRPAHDVAEPPEPCPAETRAPAPAAAASALGLLLGQPPVGADLRAALVVAWLRAADDAGRRVPDSLLRGLLDLAAGAPSVVRALHPALGERGAWLAGLNPAWRAAAPAPADGDVVDDVGALDWREVGADRAPSALAAARHADPAAARASLERAWAGLPARERRPLLDALATGLGPDDEPLLEQALDDRAATVRAAAQRLLDTLPTSARGRRMAERLRPLVGVAGLRRRLRVDLPGEPDDAAVRDGVAAAPAQGEPDRLGRLRVLVLGAPLATLLEATGLDLPGLAARLDDEPVLREAVVEAVVARRERAWAAALVDAGVAVPRLVALLEPGHRERVVLERLGAKVPTAESVALLDDLPRPWGRPLAERVLELAGRPEGDHLTARLGPVLPTALPAEVGDRVQRVLARLPEGDRRRRALRDVLQYQSFLVQIQEAFR